SLLLSIATGIFLVVLTVWLVKSINQSMLENALEFWKNKFGSITEFDGYAKVCRYGFKSD
ncbi:MAG: hypothetical protein AAGA16_23090, partial [Cyanobacteria bacterium P01_E01_bin.35]